MKKLVAILSMLFALTFLSAAQTGSSDQGAQKKTTAKGGGAVLSGCLSGPNDEGVYVLKSGKRSVEVGGNDDLSKHVNHEVKLHGTWAKSGADIGEKQDATANFAPTHHVDRVRRKLLQLADSYGHVVRDGVRIDFPISHSLLAEMVGSSRETVTRAVDALQRTGFVDRRGSTYRLLLSPNAVAAELER